MPATIYQLMADLEWVTKGFFVDLQFSGMNAASDAGPMGAGEDTFVKLLNLSHCILCQ